MIQRPPLSVKILFAIGQLGWSLASFGVMNLIPYFFMPPEEAGKTDFPDFIYQGAILGGLTIVGLIASGGRLFDAFTDPLIANWSDKTNSKFGKRKKLLAISVIPFALFAVLIFVPPSFDNTTLNAFWLVVTSVILFVSFTTYVVPYNALIGELGHHPKDRMLISTLVSVTWALGFAIGGSVYALQGYFEQSMSSVQAFQYAQAILCGIAFICMLFPILFLNEKKYCKQTTSSVNFLESLDIVLGNNNFRFFVIADLTYWISVTIIQTGMIYYVTILLGMDKSQASLFAAIAFPLSFLCYIPVNFLVAKFGKKPIVSIGFLLFALTFVVSMFLGKMPIPPMMQFYILIVMAAMPLAIFGIIPTAIIADIINQQAEEQGESQAGMFFAVRTFMLKMGGTIALLIFPSLLLLGRSAENDWGIRATGIVALVFCLLGFLLFQRYQEVGKTQVNDSN